MRPHTGKMLEIGDLPYRFAPIRLKDKIANQTVNKKRGRSEKYPLMVRLLLVLGLAAASWGLVIGLIVYIF